MQPSSKYASTEKTYAGGFVYKETDSNFSAIFGLDDELDMSVSYTTPINSNLNNVTMGGWNNSSASAYVTKDLQFSKNWLIPAGTRAYCNVNGLNVSKDSFSSSANVTVVFGKGQQTYYYFGKSAQASSTVGSFANKLITDFNVSHIAFKAVITGWTKADFEYFIANGTLQDSDGYSIDFDDFMTNPTNYYIRTFDPYAYAYWDGSTWKGNNLSNSPNIHLYFLINSDKVSGISNFNKHHFNAASGTNHFGVEYKSVSNNSSSNATNITALIRGSVASQLNSDCGFILDKAVTPLKLDLDISHDALQNMCDSGATGSYDTLPAHEVEFCPAVRVLRYDKWTMSYDVGSSGLTHPTDYRMYFCMGMKGEYVSKILAYAGVYFYTKNLQDLIDSGATPTNMKVTGMRLGEMNSAGETTGNWINPNQMDDYIGPNKDGSIIHPNYNPQPPSPPSGDDMESMATGASGSSGGFTHFYVMSPQDLIDFLADFYDHASSGETLTNNLVCSYILGIPSSEFCATQDVPIAIHNSAQGTPFVSQADYAHITATNNLLVIGSFNVPRMTNTFYDFAPYSTYEVFIPCCGWVSLPDTVAGRSINVEMYIDIASCCLKAAVKINDLGVCAVTNGVLGAAIPIAVIESGILRGNNIQAGLGIIGGGINTGVGAGSGNAMGIGFGVQQILSGLVDCTIAGNTNYTQQKGGTGDITQFAMGHKCYMKVTHPDIDEVVNNSIFGHSVGYLCNMIDVLSNFHGFTVCGNPHVTFSASAEEREEIERLLSMGVIL